MTDNPSSTDKTVLYGQLYTCRRCKEPATLLYGSDKKCLSCHTKHSPSPPTDTPSPPTDTPSPPTTHSGTND